MPSGLSTAQKKALKAANDGRVYARGSGCMLTLARLRERGLAQGKIRYVYRRSQGGRCLWLRLTDEGEKVAEELRNA